MPEQSQMSTARLDSPPQSEYSAQTAQPYRAALASIQQDLYNKIPT